MSNGSLLKCSLKSISFVEKWICDKKCANVYPLYIHIHDICILCIIIFLFCLTNNEIRRNMNTVRKISDTYPMFADSILLFARSFDTRTRIMFIKKIRLIWNIRFPALNVASIRLQTLITIRSTSLMSITILFQFFFFPSTFCRLLLNTWTPYTNNICIKFVSNYVNNNNNNNNNN